MTRLVKNRYELGKRLDQGSGGFGEVFAARDKVLGRHVALKFLKTDIEAETRVLEQFFREATATARIDHPAVVRIYEFHADPPPVISMELIEGAPLSDVLRNLKRIQESQVAAIGYCLAGALSAAHSSGVVHGDLKPSNCMATPGGDLKLLDFGAAQEIGAGSWNGIGTPGYQSPEQLSGSGTVIAATDTWSLGVLLYELVTGERPFTQARIAASMFEDEFDDEFKDELKAVLLPHASSDLRELILSMLNLNPNSRPDAGTVGKCMSEILIQQETPNCRHQIERLYHTSQDSLPTDRAAFLIDLPNHGVRGTLRAFIRAARMCSVARSYEVYTKSPIWINSIAASNEGQIQIELTASPTPRWKKAILDFAQHNLSGRATIERNVLSIRPNLNATVRHHFRMNRLWVRVACSAISAANIAVARAPSAREAVC